MSKIKYILRDFWWVIIKINLKKDWYAAQIARIYNLSREEMWKHTKKPFAKFRRGEIDEKTFWKMLSISTWSKIPSACSKVFTTNPKDYSKPNKSIINFIKKIKKLWYTSILLSDVYPPNKDQTKKLWRYDEFEHMVLSCNVGLSKFDDTVDGTTKIFDYALKKYNIKADEVIFIDDVEKNCLVAQKLWIKTVVAAKPSQVVREVKKLLKIK